MIAALALFLATGVRAVRVVATGPLQRAEVAAGASPTRLYLDLGPGESRSLSLPLTGAGVPRVGAVEPRGGAVRIDGTEPATALDPALRARPVPWPAAPVPRVPGAALALVAATLAGVAALRRRPGRALAVGIAGALVAASLRPQSEAVEAHVLEGATGGRAWLRVDVAAGSVRTPPGSWVDVQARRAAAPIELSVWAEGEAVRWCAGVPAGLVAVRRRVSLADLEQRGWPDLDGVWTRSADGVWSRHGAWPRGAPLAAGVPGRPPGFLTAGLPMGVQVLVARIASEPGGAPLWIRRTGSPPAAGSTAGSWISD